MAGIASLVRVEFCEEEKDLEGQEIHFEVCE
jgi:hypothetical protein